MAPLDALVALVTKRLLLGVDVAAAKFVSGQEISDPAREEEILSWAATESSGRQIGCGSRVDFLSDQIAASKIIQLGLHEYWRQDPARLPIARGVTAELRPRLDIVNRQMLLLPHIPCLSSGQLTAADDKANFELSSDPSLRQLKDARQTAVRTALRSLSKEPRYGR